MKRTERCVDLLVGQIFSDREGQMREDVIFRRARALCALTFRRVEM